MSIEVATMAAMLSHDFEPMNVEKREKGWKTASYAKRKA
ncbi:MAG: hypothetical protein V7641_3257 [Blastocatellia bacterium]